jgi:hypothetical protein
MALRDHRATAVSLRFTTGALSRLTGRQPSQLEPDFAATTSDSGKPKIGRATQGIETAL